MFLTCVYPLWNVFFAPWIPNHRRRNDKCLAITCKPETFPWFRCGTSGYLAWMYWLYCRRMMCIWYLGGTQCSKPASVSCEDNPAKLGNCDDPSTCKGLALQGIDTSVRKTCFWCELRNKSCLHNLGAWHGREKYRGRAEMENNRVLQCGFLRKKWRHTDFWVLVSWEMPCLLLLLNLPFTPASWLNRLLLLLGCNSAICPSCRDAPGITAARLCS